MKQKNFMARYLQEITPVSFELETAEEFQIIGNGPAQFRVKERAAPKYISGFGRGLCQRRFGGGRGSVSGAGSVSWIYGAISDKQMGSCRIASYLFKRKKAKGAGSFPL